MKRKITKVREHRDWALALLVQAAGALDPDLIDPTVPQLRRRSFGGVDWDSWKLEVKKAIEQRRL